VVVVVVEEVVVVVEFQQVNHLNPKFN